MTLFLLIGLVIVGPAGAAVLSGSVRVVRQYERGVVYRLGQVRGAPLPPGLAVLARGRGCGRRNSTLVLPFPVELLRFLERVTSSSQEKSVDHLSGEGEESRLDSTSARQVGAHASSNAAPSSSDGSLGFMAGQCG
jgi:hypothetical protein